MLLNNVDGRNPAPVDIMVSIPLLTGFYTSQVVVSDFFHQQYYYYFTFLGNAVHCATHSNPCKKTKKTCIFTPPSPSNRYHQDYYIFRLGHPELNLHLPLASWVGNQLEYVGIQTSTHTIHETDIYIYLIIFTYILLIFVPVSWR